MIRKAAAVWRGNGRSGTGDISTESGVLEKAPYCFETRFENERGTNPEELVAASPCWLLHDGARVPASDCWHNRD
jgi:lipoyl-dependent peroxiredoxin